MDVIGVRGLKKLAGSTTLAPTFTTISNIIRKIVKNNAKLDQDALKVFHKLLYDTGNGVLTYQEVFLQSVANIHYQINEQEQDFLIRLLMRIDGLNTKDINKTELIKASIEASSDKSAAIIKSHLDLQKVFAFGGIACLAILLYGRVRQKSNFEIIDNWLKAAVK
ncbi:hypothetical protein [Ammoniphilus sp. CFH 90114]|uniref:hypothetical protein n=1 Tax=Ammoniphilus sp. CFH 90114 TaxID=2493665 RepID=UPI00100DA9BC|nr:hypothetical protein [Ammoniphilus sp. CFH 90114]RXT08844.1 hypothetical protein EIZ39_08570 [Ammoniphilus sp. CFH 90114]